MSFDPRIYEIHKFSSFKSIFYLRQLNAIENIFFSLSYKAIYWIDITFEKATETERIYENVLFATFTALHDFSLCVCLSVEEKKKS